MELRDIANEHILAAGVIELVRLQSLAGIDGDEKLTSAADIKERLILMKRKMNGTSNKWQHLFKSVKAETRAKSEALVKLYESIRATFETLPSQSLSNVLLKEGILQDNLGLVKELERRMDTLRLKESLIIVAGETNGGKSTFLNLLLGEDILPTDVLHCTIAVCKIVYSKTYSVKTVDREGIEHEFPCQNAAEAKAILKEKAANENMRGRQQGTDIREITLSLPADILKSGITLVDTPGIGEDDMMDEVTLSYTTSTHASGFIYIIKSDTAGGVQEDRLMSFLRAIKCRYNENDTWMESFDPKAAMFVCHRWDNIKPQEENRVKQNALQKLECAWPGFRTSQMFFFSTVTAKKHYVEDPEYVTDSFFTLLGGLKKLFDLASHNAIRHQYIWLKHLLPQSSKHLQAMITHCNHSSDDLETFFRTVAEKQENLLESAQENSDKILAELKQKEQHLLELIKNILQVENEEACDVLGEYDQIQEMCSEKNFFDLEKNRRWLDERVVHGLLQYVHKCLKDSNAIDNLETEILHAIQHHLGLFKSQIRFIHQSMMHGEQPKELDLSSSSNFGSSTTSMSSTESSVNSLKDFADELSYDPSQLSSMVSSVLNKKKKGHMMKRAFPSIFIGILKDKSKFTLKDRLHLNAERIRSDEEILNGLIKGYSEWIEGYVKCATRSIPKFIEVNNRLMDEIREHRLTFQQDKTILKEVMETMEPSRDQLRGYGYLYMNDINADSLAFNMDRRSSSIQLQEDFAVSARANDDSGFQGSDSKKRKVRSLWARLQGATILVDNNHERVVVKIYTCDMEDSVVLSEIAALRCLEHENVAPFFGMTRIVVARSVRRGSFSSPESPREPIEKLSAFIFKGDLISTRVYSKRTITNLQQFIPNFLHSLLRGLYYLHRERLVHMELNLDTVMVDKNTGEVKLCQMCKPREAKFPARKDIKTNACICLSPYVLQGHTYELTDDIYAFGLLLWELLFPDENLRPFKEQRTWPLSDFIEKCNPKQMLESGLTELRNTGTLSEAVEKVLQGTVLIQRGQAIMTIPEIQSALSNISEDSGVVCMRSRRGQRLIHVRKASAPVISVTDFSRMESVPEDSIFCRPQRPPRRKDRQRVGRSSLDSDTIDETSSADHELDMPIIKRHTRRASEPAVTLSSLEPNVGKKSGFLNLLKQKFKRKKPSETDNNEKEQPIQSQACMELLSQSVINLQCPLLPFELSKSCNDLSSFNTDGGNNHDSTLSKSNERKQMTRNYLCLDAEEDVYLTLRRSTSKYKSPVSGRKLNMSLNSERRNTVCLAEDFFSAPMQSESFTKCCEPSLTRECSTEQTFSSPGMPSQSSFSSTSSSLSSLIVDDTPDSGKQSSCLVDDDQEEERVRSTSPAEAAAAVDMCALDSISSNDILNLSAESDNCVGQHNYFTEEETNDYLVQDFLNSQAATTKGDEDAEKSGLGPPPMSLQFLSLNFADSDSEDDR